MKISGGIQKRALFWKGGAGGIALFRASGIQRAFEVLCEIASDTSGPSGAQGSTTTNVWLGDD
jgi:hypothetical protein